MNAGICSIIWKDRLDIFEVIETAARVGAEGIEIWGQPPHIPEGNDPGRVADIAEAMQARDIIAPQFGSYARATAADFAEKLQADLQVTAALNAPAMRIWAGAADSEVADADHWARVIDAIRLACQTAADLGLLITLERHQNTVTNSLWGCQRVIDELDHPALRINYQVIPTDPEVIDEEIRILSPHILNTHATNARHSGGQREASPLADGDTDWARLIQALRTAGTDGFVEIEFVRRGTEEISLEETETELAADLAFLKGCMA